MERMPNQEMETEERSSAESEEEEESSSSGEDINKYLQKERLRQRVLKDTLMFQKIYKKRGLKQLW